MHQLAGILFHVDAGEPDAFRLSVEIDFHMAVHGNGQFILGDLVPLGKIRVEIIFAGKAALGRYGAMGRQGHAQGVFHNLFVQHRQYPGHPQANRASMGIGRGTEFG